MWVLGTDPGYCAKATSILNHEHIAPTPQSKLRHELCETSLPIKVMKMFSPVSVNYQTKFRFIPYATLICQLTQFSIYLKQNKTKHTLNKKAKELFPTALEYNFCYE